MSDIIELAKALGRPIDTACVLILNMLGVPTKIVGDMLGDQLSYWQWCNRLNIAEKAAKKLRERNIDPRSLPLWFSVPLLRSTGDADDDSIQDLWAELIVSAMSDIGYAHTMFTDILHSMSPPDAVFLDAIIKTNSTGGKFKIEDVVKSTPLTTLQAKLSYQNLKRLGLFDIVGSSLNGLAFEFLLACGYDKGLIDYIIAEQKKRPPAILRV